MTTILFPRAVLVAICAYTSRADALHIPIVRYLWFLWGKLIPSEDAIGHPEDKAKHRGATALRVNEDDSISERCMIQIGSTGRHAQLADAGLFIGKNEIEP